MILTSSKADAAARAPHTAHRRCLLAARWRPTCDRATRSSCTRWRRAPTSTTGARRLSSGWTRQLQSPVLCDGSGVRQAYS